MNDAVRIETPLREPVARALRSGTPVSISGTVYGARDAAHLRMVALLEQRRPLPVDLRDAVVYYVGPAPATDGHPVGSAGPTTSGRMDSVTIPLLECGLRGTIGKGYRSPEVRTALTRCGAVYFGAVGGAGALLARCIVASRVVAFEDLGPEAIYQFTFRDFPAVVVNDTHGGEAYVRLV